MSKENENTDEEDATPKKNAANAGSGSAFQQRLESSTPQTAMAISGVVLAISLSLRIAGLDLSTPLNKYMEAKVEIEKIRGLREAQGLNNPQPIAPSDPPPPVVVTVPTPAVVPDNIVEDGEATPETPKGFLEVEVCKTNLDTGNHCFAWVDKRKSVQDTMKP